MFKFLWEFSYDIMILNPFSSSPSLRRPYGAVFNVLQIVVSEFELKLRH